MIGEKVQPPVICAPDRPVRSLEFEHGTETNRKLVE